MWAYLWLHNRTLIKHLTTASLSALTRACAIKKGNYWLTWMNVYTQVQISLIYCPKKSPAITHIYFIPGRSKRIIFPPKYLVWWPCKRNSDWALTETCHQYRFLWSAPMNKATTSFFRLCLLLAASHVYLTCCILGMKNGHFNVSKCLTHLEKYFCSSLSFTWLKQKSSLDT